MENLASVFCVDSRRMTIRLWKLSQSLPRDWTCNLRISLILFFSLSVKCCCFRGLNSQPQDLSKITLSKPKLTPPLFSVSPVAPLWTHVHETRLILPAKCPSMPMPSLESIRQMVWVTIRNRQTDTKTHRDTSRLLFRLAPGLHSFATLRRAVSFPTNKMRAECMCMRTRGVWVCACYAPMCVCGCMIGSPASH